VYTCSLPWKAALRFEATVAAMMTANVSCGVVPGLLGGLGACLAAIGRFWWVSGDPRVRVTGLSAGHLAGINVDSVLELITLGEKRGRLVNSGSFDAEGLIRFHHA
jgi:hypothetical protein